VIFKRKRAIILSVIVAFLYSFSGVFAESATTQVLQTAHHSTTTSLTGTSASNSAAATHHSDAKTGNQPGSNTQDSFGKVLLILFIILIIAKLGGDLFERIGQPAVLGELIFGILLGNLGLFHLEALNHFVVRVVNDPHASEFITTLAELGVVLLLFEVGLESTVGEMVSVGASSFLVATLGVIAPIALGFVVGELFLSHEPWTVHLFLGSVLAATSVGITARVLRDIGKMHLRESKIILGAAVIDDILGLVVLAVVQGIIQASNSGSQLPFSGIVIIAAKAVAFFLAAIIFGMLISRKIYWLATYLQVRGVLLSLTLVWCFFVSYLATLFGLAPIVGAFAAGLVLEEATFKDWKGGEKQLEQLLRPITTFLVPVFFVHMGMKVSLSVFGQPSILGLAMALTLAAIIGKQVCSLGVLEKGLNRLAVGVGMVPRGEVGLIVANIGLSLRTKEGHAVISQDAFSACVIMVVITTMFTPPLLKWLLERKSRQRPNLASEQ
jgi:Kef-type K+ transport system membrane component KefB